MISRTSRLITPLLYLMMLAYAFSITMLAPLMPLLIREYRTGLAGGGLVVTLQSIGGILTVLAGGMLIDRLSKYLLTALSFLLYGITLLLLGIPIGYTALLGVFFFLGAGTRMLDILLNALISDLNPERRGVSLNLLHSCFGIGALLGPLYSRFLLDAGVDWRGTFLILGIVCMGVLLLAIPLFSGRGAGGRTDGRGGASHGPGAAGRAGAASAGGILPAAAPAVIRDPRAWALALSMMFYSGHQAGVTTWLPMYAETTLGIAPVAASVSLSLFWFGIVAGRFAGAPLSLRYSPMLLVGLGSLLGGITLGAGFLAGSPAVFFLSVGLTGFFTGAIVPLLIAAGCSWFPDRSGTVTALIMLSSSVARMIFPWGMGAAAELAGFGAAMAVSAVVLAGPFLLSLTLRKSELREPGTVPGS